MSAKVKTRFIPSKGEIAWVAIFTFFFFVLDAGLFLEQDMIIPVKGATPKDWNHDTFWHEPWGRSRVHKGIDIFALKGTPALAAVSGLVVYQGELGIGGNAIMLLEPKWRLHYYAHLDSIAVARGDWVRKGSIIGTVGNTGNAQGKPAHLHYGMISLIPYPNQYSTGTQGWKLMFYLNPDKYLR